MPIRPVPFANSEYYHVFNRGVNRRKIFLDNTDYNHALETLQYYLSQHHTQRFSYYARLSPTSKQQYMQSLSSDNIPLVAFVFMPNHFHFLISQNGENDISNFLSIFQNSYTRYFNTKHKRTGHLFQGQFKSVHIENDMQLTHVSRYIHLNPLSSRIVKSTKELENYPWSSYPAYLSNQNFWAKFIQNDIVREQFTNQSYQNFVNERSLYQQELEDLKHLTLE